MFPRSGTVGYNRRHHRWSTPRNDLQQVPRVGSLALTETFKRTRRYHHLTGNLMFFLTPRRDSLGSQGTIFTNRLEKDTTVSSSI